MAYTLQDNLLHQPWLEGELEGVSMCLKQNSNYFKEKYSQVLNSFDFVYNLTVLMY